MDFQVRRIVVVILHVQFFKVMALIFEQANCSAHAFSKFGSFVVQLEFKPAYERKKKYREYKQACKDGTCTHASRCQGLFWG